MPLSACSRAPVIVDDARHWLAEWRCRPRVALANIVHCQLESEQLPKSGVHLSVISFPLLPVARRPIDHECRISRTQPGREPSSLDVFRPWSRLQSGKTSARQDAGLDGNRLSSIWVNDWPVRVGVTGTLCLQSTRKRFCSCDSILSTPASSPSSSQYSKAAP